MSRLSEQLKKMGPAVPANPLPKVEGDSAETDVDDYNDTKPGHHPHAGVKDGN